MIDNGHHFTDMSTQTDKTLMDVINKLVIPYASLIFPNVTHRKSISLFECQRRFGLGVPDPSKKGVSMKPDGGILFTNDIPILIAEMKVQGTNDLRFKEGKEKQATGNAVERAAKNIRGAEMLFDDLPCFPYVIFASGCDFHPSETIASRFQMMNYGVPNKTIIITPEKTLENIEKEILTHIDIMDISKKKNKSIAMIFIKTHKWDQMAHGTSLWKSDEIFIVLKTILDKVRTVFPSHP
tara:strand:- start:647 stop:1363 length:717 start_codon:yes stop_codon:yes gene_type:complete